nr:phage holin family protein [uncultured Capnocytophaga sp.]
MIQIKYLFSTAAHIESYFSAILVAFVLSFLNAFIVLLASELVKGFVVHGFWGGMMFSLCLSLSQALAFGLVEKNKMSN